MRLKSRFHVSKNLGGGIWTFLLWAHFHVSKQKWQLSCQTHKQVHTFIVALHFRHRSDVAAFISTDGTGRSKDNRGVYLCVCVCFTALTAPAVMAAEVTEPEEICSLPLTTSNLACSKRHESTCISGTCSARLTCGGFSESMQSLTD